MANLPDAYMYVFARIFRISCICNSLYNSILGGRQKRRSATSSVGFYPLRSGDITKMQIRFTIAIITRSDRVLSKIVKKESL